MLYGAYKTPEEEAAEAAAVAQAAEATYAPDAGLMSPEQAMSAAAQPGAPVPPPPVAPGGGSWTPTSAMAPPPPAQQPVTMPDGSQYNGSTSPRYEYSLPPQTPPGAAESPNTYAESPDVRFGASSPTGSPRYNMAAAEPYTGGGIIRQSNVEGGGGFDNPFDAFKNLPGQAESAPPGLNPDALLPVMQDAARGAMGSGVRPQFNPMAVSPAGAGQFQRRSPSLPFTDPRSLDRRGWEQARTVMDTQRAMAPDTLGQMAGRYNYGAAEPYTGGGSIRQSSVEGSGGGSANPFDSFKSLPGQAESAPPGFNPGSVGHPTVDFMTRNMELAQHQNPEVQRSVDARADSALVPGKQPPWISNMQDWFTYRTSDAGREENRNAASNVKESLPAINTDNPSIVTVGDLNSKFKGLPQLPAQRAMMQGGRSATQQPPLSISTAGETGIRSTGPRIGVGPQAASGSPPLPFWGSRFDRGSGMGPRPSVALGDMEVRQALFENGILNESGALNVDRVKQYIDPVTGQWNEAAHAKRATGKREWDILLAMNPGTGTGTPLPASGDTPLPTTAPSTALPTTPATSTTTSADSQGSSTGGWSDSFGGRSGGRGSGSGRGGFSSSSSGSFDADDSGWEDFLRDFDNDGDTDDKDEKRARKMAMKKNAKGRSKRGKRGGRMSDRAPTAFPPGIGGSTSPIRQQILAELAANLGRPVGGWPEGR